MLLMMAFTTLWVLGTVLIMQNVQTSDGNYARYAQSEQCSSKSISEIWSSMTACMPRDTVVELPLPDDPDIMEVIPSHVTVRRCTGVCHQGNLFHKCVPSQGARAEKGFEVMFRRTSATSGLECSTVFVETHDNCRCGCDVEMAQCTELQTYDQHFCKCRCQQREHCDSNQYWNEAQCKCLCRQEEYRECSTGFVYDPVVACECVRAATTNLAGAELVVTLVVLVILLAVATVVLAWRLRTSLSQQRASRRPQTADGHAAEESQPVWPEGPECPAH